MKFTHSTQPLFSQTSDLVMFPVFESEKELQLTPELEALDKKLLGNISTTAIAEQFVGKRGTSVTIQTHGSFPSRLVVLLGLGKKETHSVDTVLEFGAKVARLAKKVQANSVSIALTEELETGVDKACQQLVIGVLLGNYSFQKYKKSPDEEKKELETVTVVSHTDGIKIGEEMLVGETIATAVTFARDLVNEPPSLTTPTHLAEIAEELARKNKSISTTVLSKPEMKKLGMGALLAIAQGSDEEPKFIHLTYKGGTKKVITIAGKGITFDTGGLSLKPASGMETMKLDMAGAALVLAIFSVLPKLHPEITVHGLISSTENMPGPSAVKPGDIVKAMNGKTIEILNTDAEGRVVLADALSYAAKNIQSDAIIDVATLTGACMVALGEDIAGLFSNDETLTKQLEESAKQSGEKIWELPLVEDYKKLLDSHVADIKNIGGKYGGAITGALFIGAFAPEQTPWAHLDIAGPSFAERNTPLCPHGGTGFGIRMLIEYLLRQ